MLHARDSVFWPGISNDIHETGKNVEFVRQVPRQLNQLETSVLFHLMHGTTLGTDLFYWNKIDCLVVRDYFSKYLIVRKLPKQFPTHAVIKELGLIFTELGRPFMTEIRTMDLATVPESSTTS